MKKILLVTVLISLFALPMVSFGQEDILPEGPQTGAEIVTIINTISNWIFTIFLAVAVIFIIMAAIKFLTSGGDPGKVQSARDSLLYALIGVAVAVLAKGLVALTRVIIGYPK
jgi:heme/copper-type cytochrome/quinol oxidase subunit 2